MKKFLLSLLVFLVMNGFSQKTIQIKGTVLDSRNKETMVGVNVILNDTAGTTTDIFGNFSLDMSPGKQKLEFRFVGYVSDVRYVYISSGAENRKLIIEMVSDQKMLSEVVVSAGRHEQNLSEVTVSMGLIKPAFLENNNTRDLESALEKIPGITMMEDQISIRGGSGFSYGAGSRVLLMVNDLPILAGASGQPKWWATPLENIEQIEIIKGASSALFGSSALNGVVNIRTAWPGAIPQTKFNIYSGFYGNPERKELVWKRGSQPNFSGVQFSHSQRFGNFDLVLGMNGHTDDGYRKNDSRQRVGFNMNSRYRSKKVEGLNYGVNFNTAYRINEPFLIWGNTDTIPDSVYFSPKGFDQVNKNLAINIDPYITLFKGSNKHSLRTRYYFVDNKTRAGVNNNETLLYGEYQYQKVFEKGLVWSSGVSFSKGSTVSEIYGKEKRSIISGSLFTQADYKIKRWTLSLGARLELYNFDDETDVLDTLVGDVRNLAGFFENTKPVFRSGVNYKLFDFTHLRASFGQGYRYPSIAEKHIHASEGAINIFPNNTLLPETGWSSEIGIMQGFKISNWKGYIDVAGFWTEYDNMIEFMFGTYMPHPDSIPESMTFDELRDFIISRTGFQAQNITKARIYGIDATISGNGKIRQFPLSFMAGYTYTNPLNMAAPDSIKGTDAEILKYRSKHTAKGDIEIGFRKISLGFSYMYFSKIVNIDEAFEDELIINVGTLVIPSGTYILPGMKEYRKTHNGPEHIFDARISMNFGSGSRLSLVVKNIFNKEYMLRPGDVQAPRNYALQYSLKL